MSTYSRSRDVLLIAAGLAILAGCAGVGTSGSGPAAEAPAYRVGDRWVYRAVDGFRVKTTWQETCEVTTVGGRRHHHARDAEGTVDRRRPHGAMVGARAC